MNNTCMKYSVIMYQTVRFIVKIISTPDEELVSKTLVGSIASYFAKII